MRTRTFACRVALGAFAIGAAGTVLADSGFYAGFDGGIAQRPEALKLDLAADSLARERDHNKDFAWSFVVGYHFNRFVAVEAGFTDLGEVSTTLVDAVGGAEVARGKLSYSAKGKTLAFLAHKPSGYWDPYVKVGVMYSVVNLSADARVGDSGFFGAERLDEPRPFAGVGVRYAFRDNWAVSLNVDYYIRITDNMLGKANITSPRIGFAYRF